MTDAGMRDHVRKLKTKHGQENLDDWVGVHSFESRWASRLLKRRRFSCLDTETTSVNIIAEVVEIGITDGYGKVLCDTLVRPMNRMSETATQAGITDALLKKAPRLAKVHGRIQKALSRRPVCLIYNAEFDQRVLNQSTYQFRLPEFRLPPVEDLMLRFARWVGEWNPRQDDYAWMRLEGGHRAVGDCRAMIALLEKMGRVPVTIEEFR